MKRAGFLISIEYFINSKRFKLQIPVSSICKNVHSRTQYTPNSEKNVILKIK
jgi:hypothetical protein